MATILLIEDNDDIRSNISEVLLLAGHQVLVAEEGEAGIRLAKEHLPDLIICDIMMPAMDGYGVFRMLRKDSMLKKVPFIFMTAMEDAEKRYKTAFYIKKPFGVDVLMNAIDSRLKKRKSV